MHKALDIAIVGAGMMGMVLAHRLARLGHRVTVLESASQVGGLATWEDYGDCVWDRFYHVILPSDQQLIGLLGELGLETELQWQRTRTGFFVDRQLHSISSNVEFLRFPLLSLPSKIRLAFTMLYASRLRDWRKLETVTVEHWLRQVSGRENYEKLWRPLLLAKLGPACSRVSAVFIWSYIRRMFSARDRSASAEHLGHVRGGYRQIFAELQRSVEQANGCIETGSEVQRVRQGADACVAVDIDGHTREFDRVICTSPVSVLNRIVDKDLLNVEGTGKSIEYLGVICLVLVTREALSPYYVVNIADEKIPFTGLIGMSCAVAPEHTAGLHLNYLPRYLLSSDSDFEQSDELIRESYLQGLERIFPDLDRQIIVSTHVHRARRVQPLQVLGYSSLVPSIESRLAGLFVLNTSQFVDATLNNNEVVGCVDRFLQRHVDHFVMAEPA